MSMLSLHPFTSAFFFFFLFRFHFLFHLHYYSSPGFMMGVARSNTNDDRSLWRWRRRLETERRKGSMFLWSSRMVMHRTDKTRGKGGMIPGGRRLLSLCFLSGVGSEYGPGFILGSGDVSLLLFLLCVRDLPHDGHLAGGDLVDVHCLFLLRKII